MTGFIVEDYQKALERLEEAEARIAELEKELGKYHWHRNCAETPVPRDCLVLARRSSGEYVVVVEFERTHDGKFQFRVGCSNRYIDEKSIAHWRRFAAVEDDR